MLIRQALRRLRASGFRAVTSAQNIAEYWTVSTRPKTARGGYGISLQTAHHRTRIIERLYQIFSDTDAAYLIWRQLIVQHGVLGVQVHDARLVALMQVHGISHILTLNPADFARYPGIIVWTPQDVIGAQAIP